MTFEKGDRIITKECWSDVYTKIPKVQYTIENIDSNEARVRDMYGTIALLSKKTLHEIFTKAL